MIKTAHRTVGQYKIVAVWHGGTYIDLHWDSPAGNVLEVINVHDYKTGKTREDVNVSHELTEWLRENRREVPNYFRHTA